MKPNHAVFVDSVFKFVMASAVGAGGVWFAWSKMGHNNHYDQVQGSNNTATAQEAQRCATTQQRARTDIRRLVILCVQSPHAVPLRSNVTCSPTQAGAPPLVIDGRGALG